MNFLGIDNGVSGSIGIVNQTSSVYLSMPIKRVLNYTKSKQFLNRIDVDNLRLILSAYSSLEMLCLVERPMINPTRFKATVSAIRALEATIIVLEALKIPYQYIDSKEWQKSLLPSGLRGPELKLASLEVGKRLFPSINFKGCKDADGLLIAEHGRRTHGKS